MEYIKDSIKNKFNTILRDNTVQIKEVEYIPSQKGGEAKGQLIKVSKGDYILTIKKDLNAKEKKLIKLHELGHILIENAYPNIMDKISTEVNKYYNQFNKDQLKIIKLAALEYVVNSTIFNNDDPELYKGTSNLSSEWLHGDLSEKIIPKVIELLKVNWDKYNENF